MFFSALALAAAILAVNLLGDNSRGSPIHACVADKVSETIRRSLPMSVREEATMRIVTGGIAQETNTFQWQPTTLADFQRPALARIVRGEQILALGGTGTVYWRHRR